MKTPGPAATPQPAARRAVSWLYALLALAASLVLTLGYWSRAREAHQREVGDFFTYRSRDALTRIEVRMHYYEQTLLGARGLFQSHDSISREEFAAFIASFDLDAHYPGIQGIGFSQIVPAAGKERHLAQIRNQGFPDYQIRPEGNRGIYSSIIYLEPFKDRNLRAFGYDMFSEPVRHEAMIRAWDTGQTAMSGKVRLVQETDKDIQAGFAVYVPVFAMGRAVQTLEDRRRNLVGWVYSSFRMNDLMHGVLGEGVEDLDFQIYDGPNESAENLMFDRVPLHTKASQIILESRDTLTFGGHSWTVVTQALPSLLTRHGKDPSTTVLILGGLASLLVGLFTFFLAEQFNKIRQINESLEQRVEARTRELKDSETRFRTVANYGYDWEVWEGPGGGWLFCSPSCERITGHTPEAFIADPGLMERLVHPDDLMEWKAHREAVHNDPENLESAMARSSELDFRIIHPNGGTRWIGHICHQIQNTEEQSLGRRISNRDITERKQAEEALEAVSRYSRNLIETSLDPLVTISAEGKITDVNTATENATGLTRERLIGSDFADYFTDPDNARAGYQTAFSEGQVIDYPLALRHASGTVIDVLYNASVYRDEQGRILGVFAAARDVTERKKAEAQMQVLTQVLEQKNQEMEDMLYAASHDLRSPLLNVRGFSDSVSRACEHLSDRLRRDDVPESLRTDIKPILADQIPSAIHFIQSGGQKLDSLIDGLLVVSRAGRQELHLETVDMGGLLAQVQSTLAFQLQETGGSLEIEALPPCLGDAASLNQVFTNLVDNALKYRHPDRAPRIRVSGRVLDGRCIYCVEDNGLGIDPRHHARIWKLFHRVAPNGPVKGEGLGLTLVHRLLNRLHGRAWVETKPDSAPDAGSCFYVDLPFPSTNA